MAAPFICGDTQADERQQEKQSEISNSSVTIDAAVVVILQRTTRWHRRTAAAYSVARARPGGENAAQGRACSSKVVLNFWYV